MKRIPLLFCIAVLLSLPSLAQTVRLSQKYTTEAVTNPTFKSYLVNDNFYVIQDKYNMKSPINRDVQMDVFDNKGEFLGSTGLMDVSMNYTEPNNWVGLLPLSDKMVMLKAKFIKEGDKKRYDLFAYTFSNLTQRNDGVKIATTSSESGTNTGNYYVAVSPDGSKLAVLVQHPYIKEKREDCELIVFDQNLKEVWRKNYVFPFDNVKHPDNVIWVNNQGSVFVLKIVDNKSENPYQSIIAFTSNGNTVKANRLAMGTEGKTSSYGTAFNQQGDFIMAGLYFNDKKFGVNVDKPKGVFRLKVNASDGTLAPVGFAPQEFPMNTRTTGITLLDNDEVLVVAEEQNIKSTPIPDKSFEYNYEYVNGNIYVNKLSPKGEVAWQHIAKREVKSFNDGGKSNGVFAGLLNGNVTLVYRDYYYKYDGKSHTILGPAELNRFINVSRTIGMDGKLVSDQYIKRLGDDLNKEAVVIYALPQTGKQQDEKNVLFMGCSEKILYGIKVTF